MKALENTVVHTTILVCAAVVNVFAAAAPRTFTIERGKTSLTVQEIPLTELKDGAAALSGRLPPSRGYTETSNMILVSPDARRTMYWRAIGASGSSAAAAEGRTESKGTVVVDGRESPVYLAMDFAWAGGFSPDSMHYAYVARPVDAPRPKVDGRSVPSDTRPCRLVRDGKAGPTYWLLKGCDLLQARGPGRNLLAPLWSPDSRHIACWGVTGADRECWGVVADGKEHRRHFNVGAPAFSPDSRKIAYPAAQVVVDVKNSTIDVKWYVMLDRTRLTGSWDAVRPPVFSPNSRRVAYVGVKSLSLRGNPRIVRNRIDADFDRPGGRESWLFRRSSYKLIGSARGKLRERVVVDRKQETEFDEIVCEPRFSPDSLRLAYVAREGDRYLVVVDGRKHAPYLRISPTNLAFSPDGKHLAYAAGSGEWGVVDAADPLRLSCWFFDGVMIDTMKGQRQQKFPTRWHMILDQKEVSSEYSGIVTHSATFSADSRRFGYAALRDGKQFVVVDGKEGPAYAAIPRGPIFSPDGKRVAYIALREHKQVVVLDGTEGPEFSDIVEGTLRFSPDSQHIAYWAKTATGKMTIAFDQEVTREYATPLSDGFYGTQQHAPEDGRSFFGGPLLNWEAADKVFGAALIGREICRVEVKATRVAAAGE